MKIQFCISKIAGRKCFGRDEKIKISQKDAEITFEIEKLDGEDKIKAEALLNSMDSFFTELSKQYSDFISKSEV